jgi:hypothetical protein
MSETHTRIVSITAPSVPTWAVFTSEDGEAEIWTEPVHLWAQVKSGLSSDDKDTEEFLGREVPADEYKVEGMVLDEGDLVLVSESQFVFLGNSTNEQAEPRDQWDERVDTWRRSYRRRHYGEE